MKLTLITSLLLAISMLNLVTGNSESDARALIEKFISATDQQDAEELATTLHDKSMQYVVIGQRTLVFNKEEYLTQVKAKKVGGLPRKIVFKETLNHDDSMITMAFSATSEKLRFEYQVTLISLEGNWQITSINTAVSPT